jgi:hypothetical protein
MKDVFTKTLLYSAKTTKTPCMQIKYGVKTENVGYDYEKIINGKIR